MSFKLSQRSIKRMEGVHPDLVRVVKRAIQLSPVDFGVTEGLRNQARQKELKRIGASSTTNSRHLTGHAIDLCAYMGTEVRWDWPLYDKIAAAMKTAAKELDVDITWGGEWTTLKDGPHFELTWGRYPK